LRVAVRLSGVLATGVLAGILAGNTAATSQSPAAGAKEGEPAAASKATEAAAAPKRTQPAVAPSAAELAAGAPEAQFEIFLDRLMRAESNGQDDAANPRSTALGPFQFIKSTFIEVARRHFASEVLALDDDTVLALRTNRVFARRAASAFCRDNIAFMIEQGLNPTFGHLRLAFLVGPSAAVRLLQATPTTPVSEIVGEAAITANPFMKGMSAADLIARSSRDVGTDYAGPVRVATRSPARARSRPYEPAAGVAATCNRNLASCRRWIALRVARLNDQKRAARNATRVKRDARPGV
jgi:hypothetical protein